MNSIFASPSQSAFLKLIRSVRAGLAKASPTRTRTRYVNVAEFPAHLQRDMGFLDGHSSPGMSGCHDTHRDLQGWLR